VGGSLLDQLVLHGGGALVQHLERAPAGAVAGDRVGGQPLAVGVGAEVGAGVDARVQVVDAEAVDRRELALVQGQGRRLGGGGGRVLLGAGGQGRGDGQRHQQDLG